MLPAGGVGGVVVGLKERVKASVAAAAAGGKG